MLDMCELGWILVPSGQVCRAADDGNKGKICAFGTFLFGHIEKNPPGTLFFFPPVNLQNMHVSLLIKLRQPAANGCSALLTECSASVGFQSPVLWPPPLPSLIENIPWNFLTLPRTKTPLYSHTCNLSSAPLCSCDTKSHDDLRYL